MSHRTAAGGPSGGRTPEARNPEDRGERRWTIYRVRMPSGAVGEWQVEGDPIGEAVEGMFEYERVVVAEARALEEARREAGAWERSYYELKAAMDHHDTYCTAGRRAGTGEGDG